MGKEIKIPLINLKIQHNSLEKELKEAFVKVLNSGRFILGEELEKFEEEFASYIGTKYAIGVGNGTDALTLSLRAIGIKEGNEVITTPFTFVATAEVIVNANATPVFVDIEKESYNIDVTKIERAITPKTKAIIPVHLYGQPAEMEEILKISKAYKLWVIEDAAQSVGACYKGKKTGNIGDIGCFSFFPTKNLSALGDGGMITCNSEELAKKIKMLRVHGASKKYYHQFPGYNSRLDALQAAFLRVKLKKIEEWNQKRREIAEIYSNALKDLVKVPVVDKKDKTHVFHQYTIFTDKRDELRKYLQEKGIETSIHYPFPLHLQPIFSYLKYKKGDFPIAEEAANKVLSLPIYPELSMEEIEYIINSIKEYFRGER